MLLSGSQANHEKKQVDRGRLAQKNPFTDIKRRTGVQSSRRPVHFLGNGCHAKAGERILWLGGSNHCVVWHPNACVYIMCLSIWSHHYHHNHQLLRLLQAFSVSLCYHIKTYMLTQQVSTSLISNLKSLSFRLRRLGHCWWIDCTVRNSANGDAHRWRHMFWGAM